ncbi:hypothetical protein M5K25_007405 [Dendrobium thyrsiflorum]|uniref:Uncharacterized protein n=1 Tax=Dendrobium thyrsiflorum TaxID=117978 RepID=A0ABD0VKU0_DENTH
MALTRSLSEFQALFVSASVVFKCMGDPNVDHGFSYDDQGRVDVLHSPFFDVAFGNDTTADEYVERVLYQLTLAIEDQLPTTRWSLVSRRPSSPNPATSPTTSTRGIPLLLVASLLVVSLLLPRAPSPFACYRYYTNPQFQYADKSINSEIKFSLHHCMDMLIAEHSERENIDMKLVKDTVAKYFLGAVWLPAK